MLASRLLPAAFVTALALRVTSVAVAQTPPAAPVGAASVSDAALARLAADLDAARVKAGIPGMALVVVKDDKIVLMEGFGLRDAAKRLPVTPDTLFQIGSSTKAFTALTVLMAADEGKLSLDDSPKKYLSYFHLSDPDANKSITIRDLMTHRSGLARTDLAMITGALNREELIRVAGLAKPTAKLGAKFQYQNVMFTAAGEAAAQAEKTPYETLVTNRIFAPLGMTHSLFSVPAMQSSADFSRGYKVSAETKVARQTPTRDIAATAPAGAIESSARDMARWLRFLLRGDGTFEGKRLVSSANFAEWVKPQMRVGGTENYGLGWFIDDWKGHKVVQHGGNIDGFTTSVALIPEQHLGFALLINDNNAVLGPQSMSIVWRDLLDGDKEETPTAVAATTSADATVAALAPASLPGTYASTTPPISLTITQGADKKLTLTVIGQPPYPLEVAKGNRYKFGEPAPDGFFVTFRATADAKTELLLEQPQGSLTLTREAATSTADLPPAQRELAGDYQTNGLTATLTGQAGKLTLVLPGQPAYPLDPIADGKTDTFTSAALPTGFTIQILRDPATGKPIALVSRQPNGDFRFERAAASAIAYLPAADVLLAKMVAAVGGEAALRRHKTSVMTATVDFENQGIGGDETEWSRAPNARATHLTLKALGKSIGTLDDYFNGAAGAQATSFSPTTPYEGKQIAAEAREADFYDNLLDTRAHFARVEVRRREPVGGEDAFVLVETPPNGGNPITLFVSAKTGLVLRRDTIATESGIPVSTNFSDYRPVDGVQIPFLVTSQNAAQGTVVIRVQSVRFDAPLPEKVFRLPNPVK